eukprot:GSMAST32.ASY1.ANO1.1463.1 assembled CDS
MASSTKKRSTVSYSKVPTNSSQGVSSIELDASKESHPTKVTEEADLRGDYGNVALLFLLYTLQGIPMGLAGSVPFLLQEQGSSFTDQSLFSLVSWPFSLKVLWAPIVDAVFYNRLGRRKTWLLPVQLLTGILMISLGGHVDDMIMSNGDGIDVKGLTIIFFLLFFLMATQDIAVDGWALTLLQKRNIGYASSCNSIGQTLGYFVAYTGFLCLYSYKLLTLGNFMIFWGIIFIFTVGIKFYEEIPQVLGAYKEVVSVMKLPSIWRLFYIVFISFIIHFKCIRLFTALKLMEAGVSKEHLALLSAIITPIDIALTAYISQYTAGPRPLNIFLRALYIVPFALKDSETTWNLQMFYGVLTLVMIAHGVVSVSMFVAQMSFFSRVARSEPGIGGTYMTLLNTFANLGSKWPITLVLSLVDYTTQKECTVNTTTVDISKLGSKHCETAGGSCEIRGTDGYYLLSVICVACGISWYVLMSPLVRRLQGLDESAWKITKLKSEEL